MSDFSAPPPGSPPQAAAPLVFELAAPTGIKSKLLGRRGPSQLTLTPEEVVVEHAGALQAPLRFAPGSVAVAVVDPGPAEIPRGGAAGRFPILHRLGPSQIVPREMGIMGWLWTSHDGSSFTVLGDDAPNLAFVLSPPLSGPVVREAFDAAMLEDLAKRAPLGEPAVFGLLLRVEKPDAVRAALERYALVRPLTDREVPPVQRRHLPDDKPANPTIAGGEGASRAATSMPPPGRT